MPRKKSTKKTPPKHGKKLSPKEWAQIEELWASGEVTLQQLSEDFGMNASYLSQALSKRGIEKGSKADLYKDKYQEQIQEEMVSDAAMNIRRIKESKDEHYKYARTIGKLIFTKIAQAVQQGRPISDIKDDILTLKNAMGALEAARSSRWAITGLDREPDAGDEIPVLPIEEFTEEEINEIKRRQDEELGMGGKSVEQLEREIG
jgi:hypothetical protein